MGLVCAYKVQSPNCHTYAEPQWRPPEDWKPSEDNVLGETLFDPVTVEPRFNDMPRELKIISLNRDIVIAEFPV